MPANRSVEAAVGSSLLIAVVLISGCASKPAVTLPPPAEDTALLATATETAYIPVVRYGRYTLVELTPSPAQRDLLVQIVDIALPADARATVGEGMRHVLKRSGYQLCHPSSATTALFALPLPAAHYRLGPITLRDALLTLVGPAWALQVDDRARTVCFLSATPDTDAMPTSKASSLPLTTGGSS